jgi:hypothetical protein
VIRTALVVIILASAVLPPSAAPQAPPQASAAFDGYVARAEQKIRGEEADPRTFLYIPPTLGRDMAALEARLRTGDVLIEKRGGSPVAVPGGLIHDWVGITFIPHAAMGQVLDVLQAYNDLPNHYSPEVQTSRLLLRRGDEFHVEMRLREHKAITVVLDTEYDVQYGRLDAERQYSWSRSTRITEVMNAKAPSESQANQVRDHGFLWRLNTYWRFLQVSDGTFVECEGISLTRGIPIGLGWLVGPFVQDIPRESLQFTLTATRVAVLQNENRR